VLGVDAQVKEAKGLDMVRRDWCALAKDVGNYALDEILSGRPCEDVVSAIHARLRQVPPYRRSQAQLNLP
jgi:DNA polymerase alpha subunit A